MLIDWFTVIAQALNFLILVWLMRRYLYRPILDAIDAREKLVETKLSSAEANMAEATSQRDTYNQKNQEFETQKAALTAKTESEAKLEGDRIVAEAKKEADALRAQRAEALEGEFRSLSVELKRRTCEEVFNVSRRALSDLATAGLEEQMVETLDRKLRTMSDEEKAALRKQFASAAGGAMVTSAFQLPDKQRAAVQSTLKDVLGVDSPIQFESSPELVSGIELSAPGAKIGWSIGDYIQTLDERVGALLDAQ
jgi:F-type H+-transporting ATPase subunit b